MTKNNLAKWIQEEHAKVEELAHDLAELAVEPPASRRGVWLLELRERFERFRAHVIKHMAMEEEGGYMSEVLERRPTLTPEVQALRHEHGEIMRLLEFIHQSLETVTDEDRLIICDCCSRIRDVLSYGEQHVQRENLLVTSVFTQDIGSND
jgi:hypothetical protein